MSTPFLKVKNKNPYSSVPDKLLTDTRLSLQARCLAAWIVGRSDDFEVMIGPMCRMLGVSEKIWKSIRNELIRVGWWQSIRHRTTVDGKPGVIVWEHVFEYSEKSIPPFGKDGESIPPSRMDALRMDARGGDLIHLPTGNYQTDLTKKKTTTTKDPENVVVVSSKIQSLSDSTEKNAQGVSESDAKQLEPSGGAGQNSSPGRSDLLIKAGVAPRTAVGLAQKHSLNEIQTAVQQAKEKKNPAGFVVRALENRWSLPSSAGEATAAKSEAQRQYESDLSWWQTLPSGVRVKLQGSGGYGCNANFPDARWLSAIRVKFKGQNSA